MTYADGFAHGMIAAVVGLVVATAIAFGLARLFFGGGQ